MKKLLMILCTILLLASCNMNVNSVQDLSSNQTIPEINSPIVGEYLHPLFPEMKYNFRNDGILQVSYIDNVVDMTWNIESGNLKIISPSGEEITYNYFYSDQNYITHNGRPLDPLLNIWKEGESNDKQFTLVGEYHSYLWNDTLLEDNHITYYYNGSKCSWYISEYQEYPENYFCRPNIFDNSPFFPAEGTDVQDNSLFEIKNYNTDSYIYYWINDEDMTSNGNLYVEPIHIDKSVNTITAITKYKEANGISKDSPTTSRTISVTAIPPTFSVDEGKFDFDEKISLQMSSDSSDINIYYTIDGSNPRTSATTKLYTGNSIEITGRARLIRAIATGENLSCSDETKGFYQLSGPAEGILFYDKGYYSDGWRYLEATPDIIYRNVSFNSVENKTYSQIIVGAAEGVSYPNFIFGYYRKNGLTAKINGTSKDIGTGKTNTEIITSVMGDYSYISADISNNEISNLYSAKICSDLDYNDYSDWFLPSYKELYLYNRVAKECELKLAYQSSSEISATEVNGVSPYSYYEKDKSLPIIAVRQF